MRSDADLLTAWREGDAKAGRELFERHIDTVSRFFRNKVSDGREDLIQRTFLSCVEARDRIRDGSTFRAYLLRIARNKLYDHIEAQVRHAPDPLRSSLVQLGLSPSAVVARQERDGLLLQALRTLPVDLQVCVELHYWDELSMAELGEVLGVAAGTVKSRLHRARELLADALRRLLDDGTTPPSPADLDAWARSLRDLAAGMTRPS